MKKGKAIYVWEEDLKTIKSDHISIQDFKNIYAIDWNLSGMDFKRLHSGFMVKTNGNYLSLVTTGLNPKMDYIENLKEKVYSIRLRKLSLVLDIRSRWIVEVDSSLKLIQVHKKKLIDYAKENNIIIGTIKSRMNKTPKAIRRGFPLRNSIHNLYWKDYIDLRKDGLIK
jgi:hypothetical protein